MEDVRRALAQVPGVVKITVQSGEKTAGLQVESQSDSEIRPLLAKTIIERGWQLFEMKPEGLSLEDVFLQLTTKEEVGNS
ncbi:MAG: hypothetical protein BWY83_01953 [bacterium ADurb.Bin478]|nr:MAG: hypothetical protein BWY83_01953 [bacterium ADurb.Bin478]